MHDGTIFLIIGLVGLSLIFIPIADAQIKAPIDESNTKFKRIDVILYYLTAEKTEFEVVKSSVGLKEKQYQIRESNNPTPVLIEHPRHGSIESITFSQTYQNDADLIDFKQWLDIQLTGKKILYGEIITSDNNHHWLKPTPDIIISKQIIGDINEISFIP